MGFISYAQNLEDVMLYRALRHVEKGFYIDVGANHPVIDSVTKAFYDRGWHGINIEPVTKYCRLLQEQRPRDTNLGVLAGSTESERVFHEFPETGLSTLSKEYAERNAAVGYGVRTRSVSCTTLDTICRRQGVSVVHFLKIDVEGAEKEVIEGFAFDTLRPWIVVIEANEPMSTVDASEEWQALLTNKGYESVYYDGLNRYYVAAEHADLRSHFRVPPNVFDQYITYPHHQARVALAQLGPVIQLLAKGKETIAVLRLAPVRLMRRTAKSVLRVPLRSRRLRQLGGRLLAGHPTVAAKLLKLGGVASAYVSPSLAGMSNGDENLPEGASAIYRRLRELYRGRARRDT
jgi:FkbM family methyltransferase